MMTRVNKRLFSAAIAALVAVVSAAHGATINSVQIVSAVPVQKFAKVEFVASIATTSTKFYESDPTYGGLDLSAVFTDPSGNSYGIKGFYDGKNWRIRFSPNIEGTWTASITAGDSNGTACAVVSFQAVSSPYNGFARIEGSFLRFTNGKALLAIGHNTGWQTNVEQPALSQMAAQGENLLSFWIAAPWETPASNPARAAIQNATSGLDAYNRASCAYIDGVVNDAEAAGIYLLPSIWAHDQLNDGSDTSDSPSSWNNNAYSAVCSASDFFKTTSGGVDTIQWRYQKNLYRYILARWGYSRAVAGFVGVVEIESTTSYVFNTSQGDTWCAAVKSFFAGNDRFRRSPSGKYPLIISKSDIPGWDTGLDMRGTDSYTSQSSNINVASTIAYETATMRLSAKPCLNTEFGGNTGSGATQPQHLHNGIWAGLSSGAASVPLLWCDGGSFPMLTPTMQNHLQYLSQFVGGTDYLGNSLLAPASIAVTATASGNGSSPSRGWGLTLGDRGFAWIQSYDAPYTIGGQTLTIQGLNAGAYRVDWFDVWNDGGTPTSTTTVDGSSGSVSLTVPLPNPADPVLTRSDIACRFIQVNAKPVVDSIAATPNPAWFSGAHSETIAFSASATASSSVTYLWDFGDGASASGAAATHQYSLPGTYNATVTVTDGTGAAAIGNVALIVAGPVAANFQQGSNGSASDTYIASGVSSAGSSPTLEVCGNAASEALLQWNVSSIPAGSIVKSATITLFAIQATSSLYCAYAINKPWVESDANWQNYAGGLAWQKPGALGATDRDAPIMAAFRLPASSNQFCTFTITPLGLSLIQTWIDNPNENHGLVIIDASGSSRVLKFSSSDAGNLGNRPKLSINYSK